MANLNSWGLYPKATNQISTVLNWRYEDLPHNPASVLSRGLGRSYGDSCLNEAGTLLPTEHLNHFLDFDRINGILTCESGVSFDDILQLIVPHGWFVPVTPGTKFVTVGGAIANDVHGKNHHTSGNFGHHVLQIELLRSNGDRLVCSREQNSEYFHATIGGLGLTGLITWAEFKLTKIASSWINQEQIQYHSLNEFLAIAHESEVGFDYTVSWVDCVRSIKDIRGIFIRGNFAPTQANDNFKVHQAKGLKRVPFFFPELALNKYSIALFNELYFHKNLTTRKSGIVHYDPFFYPLDSIENWNRIYGRRGFLQYQFVVPYKSDGGLALREIFTLLQKSQMGSFLAVLKTFGDKASEGMLSFPREGVTLALDFANCGEPLFRVLDQCDKIVIQAGGAVYPAKDARMSKSSFASFYPNLEKFKKYVDPKFSSSFWRRVT